MTNKIIQTEQAPAAVGPYSQAVQAGNMIFTSGQIPLDPQSGQVVSQDVAEQAEQVLKNLRAVLNASGADFKDVVKCTVFLTDLANFKTVNELYAKHFGDARPARSTIQVAALPMGAQVEIEATAVLA